MSYGISSFGEEEYAAEAIASDGGWISEVTSNIEEICRSSCGSMATQVEGEG